MKSICYFLLSATLLWACNAESDLSPLLEQEEILTATGEKWQLVKMSGQIANSETTGEDMEWQEFYLIQEDGSFVKSRTRDGVTTEAGGEATYEERSDGNYLVLNYTDDSPLIGNCTGLQQETLYFESEDILIGTWQACDGPGLEYSRLD